MISVIVPVYNCEKYVARCIESILNQTYRDWELLIVNDGSTDGSAAIIRQYAAKDSRIRYFEQENQGVSVARNRGIDEAKGEWIVFVDSDDWISEDYLQKSIICTQKNPGADIIATTVELFINNKEYVNERAALAPKIFEGDLLAQTHRNPYMALRSSFCDLVIRREIIQSHLIRFFNTMKIGEDSLFAETVFAYSAKLVFSPEIQSYFYRINNNEVSLSRKINEDDIKTGLYRVIENIRLFETIGSWGTRLNACHCSLGIIFAAGGTHIKNRLSFITWLVNNKDFQSRVLPFLSIYATNLKSRIFAWVLRLLPRCGQKILIYFFTRS